jgi:hypothetical protein
MSYNTYLSKEYQTIMGVVNQFEEARALIAKELHFAIGGEASEFRSALDRAGSRRLEHCVILVRMWARDYHRGADKYQRLMRLLQLVTPEKVGKYRNPEVEAAVEANRALDREFAARVAREP